MIMLLAQALEDCVKDLLRPFHDDAIDLVAGIDAMGFILGKTLNKTLREWSVKRSHAVCGIYFKNLLLWEHAGQET